MNEGYRDREKKRNEREESIPHVKQVYHGNNGNYIWYQTTYRLHQI
jgi:hypothetical protein